MNAANALRTPLGSTVFVTALGILAALPSFFNGLRAESLPDNAFAAFVAVTCFILIPLYVVKHVFKEEGSAYGWRLPDPASRPVLLTTLVSLALMVLAFFLAQLPSFQAFYARNFEASLPFFVVMTVIPAAYYLAEEFVFRGFLLNVLWNRYRYAGALASVALFTLFHIGKPALELVLAATIGIVFSWLSLRTKSFLPAAIAHFMMAVTLNTLLISL